MRRRVLFVEFSVLEVSVDAGRADVKQPVAIDYQVLTLVVEDFKLENKNVQGCGISSGQLALDVLFCCSE